MDDRDSLPELLVYALLLAIAAVVVLSSGCTLDRCRSSLLGPSGTHCTRQAWP